jgi:galactokinase
MEENGRVVVPGRVNLIGEHIDYHNLAVLPMAIDRRIEVTWRRLDSRKILARSASESTVCEFAWTRKLQAGPAGDWGNYVKAAAQAVSDVWDARVGIEAVVWSDLPPAAGLSSSSALLTAFTLALLRANEIVANFEELMAVLPEGEYFVGTRGGAMDHAAVLAARRGCALLVNFAPLCAEPIPIPEGWRFLVSHSRVMSRKSTGSREAYNRIRASRHVPEVARHVEGEAQRVADAVAALRGDDLRGFGEILFASHRSLRDDLRVSCPELDRIVEIARGAGADGARLTGAGFGGCAIVVARGERILGVRAALEREFYGGDAGPHLFEVIASDGALVPEFADELHKRGSADEHDD